MLSGSFSTFAPVASASRTTSAESAARKAAPRYLDRGPRRTITHGAPASVPRSCSSSAVRLTVREPERVREPLRGGQVGLGELEPGQVEHLDDGVLRTPRVLAGQRTLLAVQVVVGPVVTGHLMLLDRVTDDIVTHEAYAQSSRS